MTHFLPTEDQPGGYKLEDVLGTLRRDLVTRTALILEDERPEAQQVVDNNVRILGLLSDCIALARESTHVLDHSFGPSRSGSPRIGS